jgi:hypothetical protein
MLHTALPQKAVADMLGHYERINEQHYNYSMAENELFSNSRDFLFLAYKTIGIHLSF